MLDGELVHRNRVVGQESKWYQVQNSSLSLDFWFESLEELFLKLISLYIQNTIMT